MIGTRKRELAATFAKYKQDAPESLTSQLEIDEAEKRDLVTKCKGNQLSLNFSQVVSLL